jgi:hypothetical protein
MFFLDEAWFTVSSSANIQNNKYWYSENQRALHDLKIRVWCAVSAHKIIGPTVFEGTMKYQLLHLFNCDTVLQGITSNRRKKNVPMQQLPQLLH